MNTRRNIKGMLIIFCAMFLVLCIYLVYIINAYGTRWFSSPYNTRVDAQKNSVIAGDIRDRNGKTLATTDADGDRVYIDDSSIRRATAHAVGDNYGQTFGAENFFSKYLLGFDQSLADRLAQAMSGQKSYGSDIKLTIDSKLSDYAYNCMGDYKGAVAVMNYKTGEILATISQPTFDPKYMKEYLNEERDLADSAMVNRVNSGRYTPGSVFKIVTAVAAVRYLPGVTERTFHCDGPLVFDKNTRRMLTDVHIDQDEGDEAGISGEYLVVRDYNGEYHGELTFAEAFAKSCNHVFAQLAVELGADRLKKVASDLGVGDEFLFEDLVTASSSFEKGKSEYETAWSGIGQHKDIMTPLNMLLIAAGIANDGVMMEPKLLLDVEDYRGASIYAMQAAQYRKAFSQSEAKLLQELMVKAVQSGTGRNARVSGYTVGGKTGTAEVSSGEARPNAWFVGFIQETEHPLAICVVLEQGGSGGSNAAPIAGKVLKRAIELGY